MPSTHKAASSRGSIERFATAYPLYFRMSGLLVIAALATTLIWANSLAMRGALSDKLLNNLGAPHWLTLLLETACLLIVLTALALVAAQLWIRLVRRADQALALLPADVGRSSGDEIGRLTQTVGRLSRARAGHAAAEALGQRVISEELT